MNVYSSFSFQMQFGSIHGCKKNIAAYNTFYNHLALTTYSCWYLYKYVTESAKLWYLQYFTKVDGSLTHPNDSS